MDAILTGPYGPTQLGPGITVLGRTQDNQIVVNDVKASSHHAELRPTGQDYTITDLGSTNGTYVNDQQIDRAMPRILRPGDRIRIGDTTYTFEVRNSQQPGMGTYSNQGSNNNPSFAPTQMAQPQYPGTAYGGNSSAQNFSPTLPAADFQQGGFQPYPGAQNSFPPPPVSGSSFNQYNQPTQAASYSPPPPPQYNPGQPQQYGLPPVPGAYAAQGAGVPPYVAPSPPPKRGGGLRTVLLASLALIVILGAAATFFIVRNNQVAAANASATATALTATAHTTNANATTVAVTQATGTAIVNATATAGAGVAQDGAYATGTVALDDALKDNTGGHQWQEDANCSFNQNVYEVKESHQNTFVTCFAQGTTFSNFSYRVLMTVISGDCSGIAFRGNANSNKQYYFEVCQTGRYALLLFDGSTDKYLIRPTSSSSIKSGVGKINVVAITANNDTIQLYANSILLNTAQDATLTSGSIGVVAVNHTSSATDTAFAGAKVWTI
ncbi:MAG: hypothetical protein NVS4B1_13180 [Ktedonobacteraceae bacterium]